MNVSIVHFSGTGNTKAVALGYGRALEKAGHTVSLSSIEKADSPGEHDLLIVGGPIYAGNVPDELIAWVRRCVPAGVGRQAIVFTTSAGLANAHGVRSIARKLARRGYEIVDTPTFEMPRNFYIDKYEPTPDDVQKTQFETAGRRILESVGKLGGGDRIVARESVLWIDLMADLFRIMAKSMGRQFHIDDTCIGCGTCERNCPKRNIDFRKKAYGGRCMLCTRCIHNCPVNAISYKGKKVRQYRVRYNIET